ncbi:MAG: hypothetical protein ACR2JK_15145 [Geodermatophilaceae bacterium]
MNAEVRLAGFALAVIAVFGVGFGAGTAVGPLGDDGTGAGQRTEPRDMPDMEETR